MESRIEYTPDVTSFFDRFVKRSDDILLIEVEFAVFVHPSIQVLTKGETSNGHVIAVDQVVLQQEMQDLCKAWLRTADRVKSSLKRDQGPLANEIRNGVHKPPEQFPIEV